MVARLAANAPMSNDTKIHKAALAEALRAMSAVSRAAVSASFHLVCMRVNVSLMRFSASAWVKAVRCATICLTYRTSSAGNVPVRRLLTKMRLTSATELAAELAAELTDELAAVASALPDAAVGAVAGAADLSLRNRESIN